MDIALLARRAILYHQVYGINSEEGKNRPEMAEQKSGLPQERQAFILALPPRPALRVTSVVRNHRNLPRKRAGSAKRSIGGILLPMGELYCLPTRV
jgi:hypothetical protein